MLPKVKFLTVIWGETYINRFCSLSLPSFLAPGNLPALAVATDLEVVVMSRESDFTIFEGHIAFKRLREVCSVRFVAIDDLIATSVYGVTLTLAYARPIIACGPEMLNTHFVFMNADFVLANGSLKGLCKHILDGRSIVLAPSFRATAEDVEPILDAAVDATTGVLNLPPRQMVELSLDHPHRTTVAKTRNQDAFCSTHPNQLFWSVDRHTVLGRYYLIFMLCLKPERIIETINSYCDYSLIPELCPSGDEAVMNDSDDFFMLELQERNQETHILRHGQITTSGIAQSLQEWTTAEHRRAATHDIIFHARDIPPAIERAKIEARSFVSELGERLASPKSHVGHRYWVFGVETWKEQRAALGKTTCPPELADYPLSIPLLWHRLRAKSSRILRSSTSPELSTSPLSPNWFDSRLLDMTIKDAIASADSILIVSDTDVLMPKFEKLKGSVELLTRSEFLSEEDSGRRYSSIMLHFTSSQSALLQELLARCASRLAPGGVVNAFILRESQTKDVADLPELIYRIAEIFGGQVEKLTVYSVASYFSNRRLIHLLGSIRHGQYARYGVLALFWLVPVLVLRLSVTLAGNFVLRRFKPKRGLVAGFSSMAIRVRLFS